MGLKGGSWQSPVSVSEAETTKRGLCTWSVVQTCRTVSITMSFVKLQMAERQVLISNI